MTTTGDIWMTLDRQRSMLVALFRITSSAIHQPAFGDASQDLPPFLVESVIVGIGIHLKLSTSRLIWRSQAGAGGEYLHPHDS